MISHFRSLWEWDIVWWESKRGQTKHHLFGEFTAPIHLCVCLKGEISCKETIKTAATAKDLLKNQTEQEDAKLKMFVWWIRTESLPPFGPIVISFLDSFSPHTSEMWNIPCEIRMTSTKVLRSWRSITQLREFHRRAYHLELPSAAPQLENSTVCGTTILQQTTTPESKLNWTHNDWRWHKNRGLYFLKTRIEQR